MRISDLSSDVCSSDLLFDRQFEKQRMGDGEFGLRAYLSGCIGISNPNAKRIHLKVGNGGLRQIGSWDGFRPTKLFATRPIPRLLYLPRRRSDERRVGNECVSTCGSRWSR